MTTPEAVAVDVRGWLDRAVVGMGLCPWARGPLEAGAVRVAVSQATTLDALLEDLAVEASRLVQADPAVLETTLLAHPWVLDDFLDQNDALDLVEALFEDLGLDGVVQVVPFHPDFRFADAPADDAGNHVNRSPWPLLHLLREASVARVAGSPEAELLPARNAELLRSLTPRALAALARRATP